MGNNRPAFFYLSYLSLQSYIKKQQKRFDVLRLRQRSQTGEENFLGAQVGGDHTKGRMLLRAASLRLVRRASRGSHSGTDPLSVVAAVRADHSAATYSTRRLAVLGGAALCGYWAYGKASNGYAYVQLGAAATEQLFMQGLEGTVELEMTLRPFSSVGELRGNLTPVSPTSPWLPRSPPGPRNGASSKEARSHQSFSLISHPPGHPRSRDQQHQQPEPVPTVRHVGVLPPLHISALGSLWSPGLSAACQYLLGESLTLCCTKSRGETKFFPRAGGGEPWTLDGSYVGGRLVRGAARPPSE